MRGPLFLNWSVETDNECAGGNCVIGFIDVKRERANGEIALIAADGVKR